MDDLGSIRGRGNSETVSLRHRTQTGSGAHPTSYAMGTVGSYPGIKWLKA